MPVLSWLFVAGRSRHAETQQAQLTSSTAWSRRRSGQDPRVSPSPYRNRNSFLRQPIRPSPQSQSFSRSYGSILPTSLTYIVLGLEAVHLGDLLRIWVRPTVKITLSPTDFQGPTRVHRTAQDPRCFTEATPLSPDKPIPGGTLLTKKRELFPGLQPTSLCSFALPHLPPERGDLHGKGREY